eukprot:gene4132-biopygen2593
MLWQCLFALEINRPGRRRQTVIGKARQVLAQLDLTAQFLVDDQGLHLRGDNSDQQAPEYKSHVRNYFQTRAEKTLSSHMVHRRYNQLLQDELIEKALAHTWLIDGLLRPQTEGFIAAIQDGTLLIKAHSAKATWTCTPRCRLCRQAPETVTHIISTCNRHHHSAYKLRHDQTLIPVLNELLDTMDMGKQVCRERSDPKPEYVGEKGRILRDVMVEPDRRAYRPDMMVYDNEKRIITVVELTLPHDTHPEIARAEKLSKYRSLVADLHNLVIVVGALGTMTVPMTSGIKNHHILGENATQLLKDVQRATLVAVWSDLQCADPHGALLLGLALQSSHFSPESFNGCSISSDKASRKTAGRWPWKLESAQECVITHLPNQPALKMDGAQASCLYSAVGRTPQLSKSKGGGGRDATFGADLGEMASSANLGGSSKYSNESFEDRSRERFRVNSSWIRASRS